MYIPLAWFLVGREVLVERWYPSRGVVDDIGKVDGQVIAKLDGGAQANERLKRVGTRRKWRKSRFSLDSARLPAYRASIWRAGHMCERVDMPIDRWPIMVQIRCRFRGRLKLL